MIPYNTLIVLIGYHLVHILGPRVGIVGEPHDAPVDPTKRPHRKAPAR